jgi:leucyl/phenylalanyl-tRNA---protein transferase
VTRRAAAPVRLRQGGAPTFPDPRRYDQEGLVAVGGDLSPARLLLAYRSGIFPWYGEGYLPLWWSPDPRAVFDPGCLHVSKSLSKCLRRKDFELSWNRAFRAVMTACGDLRATGTWILPEMVDAYERLHQRGAAHSLEVWRGDQLVGGIYGVQVGALFAAESMFHRATDMSKVALVALVRSAFAAGIELLDVQMPNEHLLSLGCRTVPRADYLRQLAAVVDRSVDLVGLVPRVDPGA